MLAVDEPMPVRIAMEAEVTKPNLRGSARRQDGMPGEQRARVERKLIAMRRDHDRQGCPSVHEREFLSFFGIDDQTLRQIVEF